MYNYKILSNLNIGHNGFVFNTCTGCCYLVNTTGLDILNMMIRGDDISKIVDNICERFDLEREAAITDVEDFVNNMKVVGIK